MKFSIIILLLFVSAIPFAYAQHHGGQQAPPISFGDGQLTVATSIFPTDFTAGKNSSLDLIIRLFDTASNQNIENVTYRVQIFHESDLVANQMFFDKDGELNIKIKPKSNCEQKDMWKCTTYYGESDPIVPNALVSSFSSVPVITGPVFDKSGSYTDKTAIIGGGDGGVARECISKNFNFIDWFELDPEVVDVCNKHLGNIGKKATEKNSVKCVWGDAFESIKSIEDDTYDHIFVDLNDDQFCIDLAAKNMDSMIRILKPKGVITAQVGSQDKKPKQVDSWLNVFNHHFGNTKLSRVYIPSFDCSWNFSSSINH